MTVDDLDQLPAAPAIYRRKKRDPTCWHYRIARCPYCGKPHSAPAPGIQRSQCIGEQRVYLVVTDETASRTDSGVLERK